MREGGREGEREKNRKREKERDRCGGGMQWKHRIKKEPESVCECEQDCRRISAGRAGMGEDVQQQVHQKEMKHLARLHAHNNFTSVDSRNKVNSLIK